MTKPKKKIKDYESAVDRLETITDRLESGEVKLDEAIALYTEGMEIAAYCDSKLNAAEAKIKIITRKNDRLTETFFESDDDELGNGGHDNE